ncbi:hypothetical protein SLA2020_240490 [Shorea laevis]
MAEEQRIWRLHSRQYLGEISALCFLHLPPHLSSLPYLLAGSGSQVLLYDLKAGKMIQSFHVFDGIRVHGIACSLVDCREGSSSTTTVSYKIVVYGEKRVKIFNLRFELEAGPQTQQAVGVDLSLVHTLPRFSHWVLDVLFLEIKSYGSDLGECRQCLAVGCSNNAVCLFDLSSFSVILEIQSPDRCLLYSMRLWGNNLKTLRIASGTIYNEIIVWKVTSQTSLTEDHMRSSSLYSNSAGNQSLQYNAVHICTLSGHEGSIFRIMWSSDGSKLVSTSDDRSARIWTTYEEQYDSVSGNKVIGPVLFGHNARVWDCCISNSLIVTAGEDCTCRVWGLDGKQIQVIKEHIGRGIWRCLYDPNSSLLVTAGFDSAIKIHQLHASVSGMHKKHDGATDRFDGEGICTTCIPNSSEHVGLMDSKSEYVRCLRFKCEDTLYIATNHGYLYHARLSETGNVKWTELVRVSGEVPVICMDLLSKDPSEYSCGINDWIALGDGKGSMTIVGVNSDISSPEVSFTFTWTAGNERQLLGTYWCKSLGCRYVFTTDPRGLLKLWRLCDASFSACDDSGRTQNATLIAEFLSCYGTRIMCLDASLEEEVLVCGDLRGNLVLFALSKGLLLSMSAASTVKTSPLNYFKVAHGISSVSSISVFRLNCNQVEIRSTGADGCICYFEYGKDRKTFEFIGMKQVKELSSIQSVSTDDLANCNYAAGFSSTDFIIWNLITEAKVLRVPCGGWRRPHSYYLGDVPETKNCFAYVKDDIIHIHRNWILESEKEIFPQNLHLQFHGREMHALLFVYEDVLDQRNCNGGLLDKSSWIATGCEDGTVRLTRFIPGVENWLTSKLLGEHVGGSAVRSMCFVSKAHKISSDGHSLSGWRKEQSIVVNNHENPCLLISVGAKRVLTSWLLRSRSDEKEEKDFQECENGGKDQKSSVGLCPSMSFQWLSSDMPTKSSGTNRRNKIKGLPTSDVTSSNNDTKSKSVFPEKEEAGSKTCLGNKHEDDWRYLAVTAFLVKHEGSRLYVCFVVVACSDATVALRALVLPHRLWFDIAVLVPTSSPVLSLQHVVIPMHLPSEDKTKIGSMYIVISGATDGSIAFWDITKSVEAFFQWTSILHAEKFIDCQKRPRTGRGSQGGRQWKSLNRIVSEKGFGGNSATKKAGDEDDSKLLHATCGISTKLLDQESSMTDCPQAANGALIGMENINSSPEICEVRPIHVMKNVHQSGVNCLHVSEMDCQSSGYDFLFNVVSGGDDQALHCLRFCLSLLSRDLDSQIWYPERTKSTIETENTQKFTHYSQNQTHSYQIVFFNHHRITSAHSSAVKGIWTDGTWVFSTGLDQRIRCWCFEEHGQLTEHAHLIISVPEPEALDARACSRNHYQIAVAGRGMQMVEFSTT